MKQIAPFTEKATKEAQPTKIAYPRTGEKIAFYTCMVVVEFTPYLLGSWNSR